MATYLPNITDQIPDPALYTPDFSFLDRMLRRRQGQYEQGFQQVNSAYNFVNRNVTNPYSVQVRDTFLKQAQNNLKDLSAMDLSQPQNVETARGVFEPFVKNKAVLTDMALTSHWNNQEDIAEMYRMKDNGKEYSDTNINYVRQQRNAFAQDDISNVSQYYSNKRYYTPYYDWNKEVQEKMKDFKPSSTKIERQNGMYLVTTKDASWNKEEISQYLDSVLSDKAKNQMRLEAAVYYPNPQQTAVLYAGQASKDLPVINNKINQLNQAYATEKNVDRRKQLQDNLTYLSDRAKEISNNLKSIEKGDVSFLNKNYERIAQSIYMSQNVDKLSKGFSHQDIEQTMTPDQVSMMYARMAFDREEKRKDREAQYGTLMEPIPVTIAGEKQTTSSTTLRDDVKNAESAHTSAFNSLKDWIVSVDPAFKGKPTYSITSEQLDDWILKHPNDAKVKAVANAGASVDIAKQKVEIWNTSAEESAKSRMGSDYDKLLKYRDFIKGFKIEDNTPKPATNKMNNILPAWNPNAVGYQPVYDNIPTNSVLKNKINMDLSLRGQKAFKEQYGVDGLELEKRFKEYKNDFQNKKNTIDVGVNRSGFTLSINDKRYKQAKGYLESITGTEGKIAGIVWAPHPDGMGMQFKLDDATATNPIDRDKMKNDLIAKLGNNNVVYDKNTDTYSIGKLGSQISPYLDPYAGMAPLIRQSLSNIDVIHERSGEKVDSVPVILNGSAGSYTFYVKKIFGDSPDRDSYVININGHAIRKPFSSSIQAYDYASILVNSPKELSILLNDK